MLIMTPQSLILEILIMTPNHSPCTPLQGPSLPSFLLPIYKWYFPWLLEGSNIIHSLNDFDYILWLLFDYGNDDNNEGVAHWMPSFFFPLNSFSLLLLHCLRLIYWRTDLGLMKLLTIRRRMTLIQLWKGQFMLLSQTVERMPFFVYTLSAHL